MLSGRGEARRSRQARCLRTARGGAGRPAALESDPKTGVEAPLTFGKLLDYRNPSSEVGSTVRLTQWFAGPWGGLLHACCFRRAASIAATTIPTRCVAS